MKVIYKRAILRAIESVAKSTQHLYIKLDNDDPMGQFDNEITYETIELNINNEDILDAKREYVSMKIFISL